MSNKKTMSCDMLISNHVTSRIPRRRRNVISQMGHCPHFPPFPSSLPLLSCDITAQLPHVTGYNPRLRGTILISQISPFSPFAQHFLSLFPPCYHVKDTYSSIPAFHRSSYLASATQHNILHPITIPLIPNNQLFKISK